MWRETHPGDAAPVIVNSSQASASIHIHRIGLRSLPTFIIITFAEFEHRPRPLTNIDVPVFCSPVFIFIEYLLETSRSTFQEVWRETHPGDAAPVIVNSSKASAPYSYFQNRLKKPFYVHFNYFREIRAQASPAN